MTEQPERSTSVVIVAAMEREIAPLTSDWELSTVHAGDQPLICHEGPGVVAPLI